MSLKKTIEDIIGEAGFASLQKAIVKPRLRASIDPMEFFLPLIIAPRAILTWLIHNIKPMKIGEYKDIKFPGREDILIHIEKQDIDLYKAEFIQSGRIIHSFDKQSLPAVSAHFMTVGEAYEDYAEGEDSQESPVVMDRDEVIEEHENLVNVLEKPTDKKLKDEADKQRKELKDYKEGEYSPEDYRGHNSLGVIRAVMHEAEDKPIDTEAAKWFYSHANVKELTSVIGKLVDALVSKKAEPAEEPTRKEEMPESDAHAKYRKERQKENEQKSPIDYKKLPRNELARILRRRKARHPDQIVPRPDQILPNNKAELPSGAGMAKKPVGPKPPAPPVPASNKPAAAAAKQAQQSAKGLQAKPPTSAPKSPQAPQAPKAPAVKAEKESKTEDFIPPSKTYFKKRLEKVTKLGKSEPRVPITEAEILSPCPHCGVPEFAKSEGGYRFKPCHCFRVHPALASVVKSEDGSLHLVFSKEADRETRYAFLMNLKARLGQEE